MMEYWKKSFLGAAQASAPQARRRVSLPSRNLSFAIIPTFQYSIIPLKFYARTTHV
jgi:hypothetical protein